MPLFHIAAPVDNLTPVRVPTWNGTFRAGDDFKVAFTLVDDDCETPVSVRAANAVLALFHVPGAGRVWDYGFCHDYGSYLPTLSAQGYVVDSGLGRINFMIPAAQTGTLCPGRYRLMISVDMPEGVSTQIDGVLQVRPVMADALGNAPRIYMRIGAGAIGHALIPAGVVGGLPVDADGFPLLQIVPTATTAVLGSAVLGAMVLGSTG